MSVAAGVDRLIVTPYNSSGRVVPLNDPEFSTLTSKPPSGRAKSGLLRAKSMTIKPTTTTSMPPNGIRKTNPNAFHSKPILVAGKQSENLDEVEAKLKKAITTNFTEVKQLFQVYDRDDTLHVTVSDLKRVLTEGMGVDLSESQFTQLVDGPLRHLRNKTGCVNYVLFMQERFDKSSMKEASNWLQLMSKRMRTQSPQPDVNMDKIERGLREKISLNLHNILRALHLFDYNRDEHVQKHEMRKVLENFCFRMTDTQFDRLWARYDLTRSGVTNYMDFMQRLGVDLKKASTHGNRAQSARLTQRPASANARVLTASLTAERANTSPMGGGGDYKSAAAPVTTLRLRPSSADPIDTGRSGGRVDKKQEYSGANREQPSLQDVEKQFRKLMRENHEQIRKTCEAFDPHKEKVLSIEKLHSILNRFTVPMSPSLFNAILTRCGVKATGQVVWSQFLQHFQQPFQFSRTANTLPIKLSSHQVLPHKDRKEDEMSATDIINLMRCHVTNNFHSLKAAFLAYDPERKGKIMRRELRKITESVCMKLTDSQFKELVILLDPKHMGFVDYHQFLTLFEVKDEDSRTDWFKQDSSEDPGKKTEAHMAQDPAVAYATVEDIIRQKLITNGNNLARDVVRNGDYYQLMSREALRRLITKHALPLREDHLEQLWNKMKQDASGKAPFQELMKVLGLEPDTGDTCGLSALISMENDRFLAERKQDHEARLEDLAVKGMQRADRMSVEELMRMVRENIYMRQSDIRREFLRYDADRDGKVTRPELAKMLRASFAVDLDRRSFDELCGALQFPSGGMSYEDFLAAFELHGSGYPDQWHQMSNSNGEVSSNHIRKETVPEEQQDAESVASQLKHKILSHHESLREAFYKGDNGRKGYWDRKDFRQLLDRHMFFIDTDHFQQLMHMIGMGNHHAKMVYRDFVHLFQDNESHAGSNTQPMESDSHNSNLIVAKSPEHLAAEQVYDIMKLKAASRYPDLTRAFRSMEKDSDGKISKHEFRRLLWKFNLPIGNEEFDRLWMIYDPMQDGSVSFETFVGHVGVDFLGNDRGGVSSELIKNNLHAMRGHVEGQKMRQADITDKQMQAAKHGHAQVIEQQLRDSFSDNFSTFFRAFRSADVTHDGYISTDQLYNILLRHNYVMDQHTFQQVLHRLGMPTQTRRVSYERFLKAIDKQKQDSFVPKSEDELKREIEERRVMMQREADGTGAKEMRSKRMMDGRTDNWSVNKVVEELKKHVTRISTHLLKAFQSFDEEDTGRIKATDFRRIVEAFCFPLKDSQFKGVIQTLYLYQDLTISYMQFLDNYVQTPVTAEDETDAKGEERVKSAAKFSELVRSKTPKPAEGGMSMGEVVQRLREIVTSRFYLFAEAFSSLDYARLGVMRQEDFRGVIQQLAFRLLDEQFESLLGTLITDQAGNVDYQDFLREFSTEGFCASASQSESSGPAHHTQGETGRQQLRPQTSGTRQQLNLDLNAKEPERKQRLSRPKSAMGMMTSNRRGVPMTTGRTSRMGVDSRLLVDANEEEQKLSHSMSHCWKSFHKYCRSLDPQNTGTISSDLFKAYLKKLTSADLTDEEIEKLSCKFASTDGTERFDYTRFTRHFVLSMKNGTTAQEKETKRPQTSFARYKSDHELTHADDTSRGVREVEVDMGLAEVLRKLRAQVAGGTNRWKEMRRELKRFDRDNSCKVDLNTLKKVFVAFNVNLTESELLELADCCGDSQMSGAVNYNQLFRTVLA